ncbi:MAG: hypothetical protein HY268_09780 [Deltaproteobacteria bacterium]|nr:hypothetical protein [Deltaproteobacteria bacterium]
MALRLTIIDDTFARRWIEGTFIRACIHNVTGEVVSVVVKGNSPTSGTAVFDHHADLATLIAELQELEKHLKES